MIDDLPEIGDIFSKNNKQKEQNDTVEFEDGRLQYKDIYIYVSKEAKKWISASFIDIAPTGIGLHVLLPIFIEFTPEEMNNVKIKFEKKGKNSNILLKEAPVLVRWQEKDPVSGNLKLGLHFPGEVKTDPVIIDVLKKLKKDNS